MKVVRTYIITKVEINKVKKLFKCFFVSIFPEESKSTAMKKELEREKGASAKES